MNKSILMTAALLAGASSPARATEIDSDLVRQRRGGRDLKVSRPRSKKHRHPVAAPTLLTDERFMSRTQREAFRAGQEIWV